MLAFKVESWIWYSVVLLIAISRLYDSHVHMHRNTAQPNPSPKARKQTYPIATFFETSPNAQD